MRKLRLNERGNPFRPGFGKPPPLMAGRAALDDRIVSAVRTGPQSPDHAMLLTGIRGCGKTAFLNAMRASARGWGWGVVKITASGDGNLSRLIRERATQPAARARRSTRLWRGTQSREGLLRRGTGRLRGMHAAGFGVEWDAASTQIALTDTLMRAGQKAAKKRRGVLLTLDEMHQATGEEIKHLAIVLQEVIGEEGLPIAFLGAGLHELTDIIDNRDGMTFFQRCGRAEMGLLSDEDAREALAEPIRQAGKNIGEPALDAAIQSGKGYPYKLQLIGFHAWETAGDSAWISSGMVHGAAHASDRAMVSQVIVPMWTHLNDEQQHILTVMATGRTISTSADIARQVGMDESSVQDHFRQMETVGVINRLSASECEFMLPMMRSWLQGDAATYEHQLPGGLRLSSPADRHPQRSARQRILDEYINHPAATNSEIARRTRTSRSYVGKVLRSHRHP